MARDEQMIAALKRERATYVARGLDDRVAQVDEQLAHYGYEGGEEKAPQGRKSTAETKQTADASDGTEGGKASAGESEDAEGETTGGQAKRGTGRSRKPAQ